MATSQNSKPFVNMWFAVHLMLLLLVLNWDTSSIDEFRFHFPLVASTSWLGGWLGGRQVEGLSLLPPN